MARPAENANRHGSPDATGQFSAAKTGHSLVLLIDPVTDGSATAPIAPPATAPIGPPTSATAPAPAAAPAMRCSVVLQAASPMARLPARRKARIVIPMLQPSPRKARMGSAWLTKRKSSGNGG